MRTMRLPMGRRPVAVVLIAVITAVGALPVRANNEDLKTFTVDVDGTVASTAPGQAGVFTGDADAGVNIVLTNTSGQQTLGSANITVPAPLRVLSVDGAPFSGGSILQLRAIGLAPGASRTLALTVAVQTCASTPPVEFGVAAKQSNDFNGTGNDFTLVGASSDQFVELVGVCRLAFVDQPTSAERTRAITRVPFDEGAAAISAELRDAGDTGRATAVASAVVSLTAARPGLTPAPGLAGTTSVATVDGLATFAPGPTLAVSAFGYTLMASSPDLTSSAPSHPFDIVDDRADCPANVGCSATASKGGQSATMTLGGGPGAGNLLVSIDAGDAPVFECADYPRTNQVVSQFLFTGGDGRLGTFTSTIPGGSRPLKDYEVCWAAPYTFATKKGTLAEVQGVKPGTTDPLWVGVLPTCAKTSPTAPCVSARKIDRLTGIVTLSVLASSADPWRY